MLYGGHLGGVGSSAATNVPAKLVLVTWALCPALWAGPAPPLPAATTVNIAEEFIHLPSLQLPRPTTPSHQPQF